MIKNIIFGSMFFYLLLALALALGGVREVKLGAPFMSFMANCNSELLSFTIEIPNIPQIPPLEDVSGFLVVISLLINFFNGVINILNFVVMLLNVIIQVIQFVFIILKNLINLKENLIPSPVI